jgi:hypothetical protein
MRPTSGNLAIPRMAEYTDFMKLDADFSENVDGELCCMVLLYSYWGQVSSYRDALSFHHPRDMYSRVSANRQWLKTMQQELYRDLIEFSKLVRARYRTNGHLAIVSEFLMMALYISPDDLQRFAGKYGEEEARRVTVLLDEGWLTTYEARCALWHAGQVLYHARRLPPTQLQKLNAFALYFAALTLWMYGLLSGAGPSDEPGESGQDSQTDDRHVPMDVREDLTTQTFLLHGTGMPCLTINGDLGDYELLTNPAVTLSVAINMFRGNFPVASEPLPPLVESLTNLLREIGSELAGRESRAGSVDDID